MNVIEKTKSGGQTAAGKGFNIRRIIVAVDLSPILKGRLPTEPICEEGRRSGYLTTCLPAGAEYGISK
jgi:hypothetical protein